MSRDGDIVWIYQRIDGRWEWRREAANHEIVSTSGGQGYEHEDKCVEMARALNPGITVRHFPGTGQAE